MSKDDYEVGYGKPPKHSRFVPGESGNKGRKKRRPETSAEMVSRIRDETVTANGQQMTMFELAVRAAMATTIKGGRPRDLKALLELLDTYGALPEGDKYAEARAGAEAVNEKLHTIICRMLNMDPDDKKAADDNEKEEAVLVFGCPTCGPELRRRWHLPERKALAQRGSTTKLQGEFDRLKKSD